MKTILLMILASIFAAGAAEIRVNKYDNGVWLRRETFASAAAVREAMVGLSPGIVFRRVVEDANLSPGEEQRQTTTLVENAGVDSETGLQTDRLRKSIEDFSIKEVRALRLARLQDRYQQEQARLTTLSEDEIDFRVGIMAVLNAVNRSGLTQAQQNRFIEERDKVVAYQTRFMANRANAQTLRAALNAATTVQEIRAVDISTGWAP